MNTYSFADLQWIAANGPRVMIDGFGQTPHELMSIERIGAHMVKESYEFVRDRDREPNEDNMRVYRLI